ncbi:hypothetical protein HYH02_010140 [Chlamydomonas schloesseri]|uniref:Guanylate cyclase domain-containing protein n=1 Tax=Chlamydomonas schloesseri TaxID=2026947 RepID=A0A835TL12_9CHLO|nr:hypothetical protein HYH02_010140 [Chlamydomonas schloesseri]|eukprot:KAG2440556.1 hypothetical protein HYH02_010140 [Chlamydomonas schloesseri]
MPELQTVPERQANLIRGVTVAGYTSQRFINFTREIASDTGITTQVDTLPIQALLDRYTLRLPESTTNPGPYDFTMVSAEVMGDAAELGSFVDLTPFMLADPNIDAGGIPTVWRSAMSSAYAGTFSALPLSAYLNHLYYRKDLFAKYNISVPHTWDDLLAILRQYGRGQQLDGPTRPPLIGFCFASSAACGLNAIHAMVILGTMVQTLGPAHGSYFDPTDLRPLFTTPAMGEALSILKELRRYSLPDNATCTDHYMAHVGGRCLMTMGWAMAFKLGSHVAIRSPMRGKMGLVSVPGSARVLDRGTNTFFNCTKERCPFADAVPDPTAAVGAAAAAGAAAGVTPAATAAAPSNTSSTGNTTATAAGAVAPAGASSGNTSSSSSSNGTNGLDGVQPAIGPPVAATRLVNKIVHFDSASIAINAYTPLHVQAATYVTLTRFLPPARHKAMVLVPNAELAPVRYDELNDADWLRAGYQAEDTAAFLAEYRKSLGAANVKFELRVPGASDYIAVVENMTNGFLFTNKTFEELAAAAQAAVDRIVAARGGRANVLKAYRRSIGYVEPPPPPPPPAPESVPVGAIVGPAVAGGVLLLSAVVLCLVLRVRRRRAAARELRGTAPGVGPGTTLLVTDIQDSTSLWESLPAEVMDVAIRLHHGAMRRLLVTHHGYESATGQDSFILSFWRCDDALHFALAAQDAMLALDWPERVTTSPFAPTLAVRTGGGSDTTKLAGQCLAPGLLRNILKAQTAAAASGGGKGGGGGGIGGSSVSTTPATSGYPLASPAVAAAAAVGDGSNRADADAPAAPAAAVAATQVPVSALAEVMALRGSSTGGVTGGHDGGTTTGGGFTGALESGLVDVGTGGSANSSRGPTVVPLHQQQAAATQQRAPATVPAAGALSTSAAAASPSGGGAGSVLPKALSLLLGTTRSMASLGGGGGGGGVTGGQDAVACDGEGGGDASGGGGGGNDSPKHAAAGAGGASFAARSRGGSYAGSAAAPGGGVPEPWTGTLQDLLKLVYPNATAAASGFSTATTAVLAGAKQPVVAAAAAGNAVVVFRGLRIRMGMHSGVASDREVSLNMASNRVVYSGRVMQLAKAVGDVGAGGQVLLSYDAVRQLSAKQLTSGSFLLLYCGRHVVKDEAEEGGGLELFSAFAPHLLPRAPWLVPPRSKVEKVPGVLSAPVGFAAMAVAVLDSAAGVVAGGGGGDGGGEGGGGARLVLSGQGLEEMAEAHHMRTAAATRLAAKLGGCLVPMAPGMLQAAFPTASAGVQWLLELEQELAEAAAAAVADTIRVFGGGGPKAAAATAAGADGGKAPETNAGAGTIAAAAANAGGGAEEARGEEGVKPAAARESKFAAVVEGRQASMRPTPGELMGDEEDGDRRRHASDSSGAAAACSAAGGSLLRGGVDVGPLRLALHPGSGGRAVYGGDVVKRAVSLAVAAERGEVLASAAALRQMAPEGYGSLPAMANDSNYGHSGGGGGHSGSGGAASALYNRSTSGVSRRPAISRASSGIPRRGSSGNISFLRAAAKAAVAAASGLAGASSNQLFQRASSTDGVAAAAAGGSGSGSGTLRTAAAAEASAADAAVSSSARGGAGAMVPPAEAPPTPPLHVSSATAAVHITGGASPVADGGGAPPAPTTAVAAAGRMSRLRLAGAAGDQPPSSPAPLLSPQTPIGGGVMSSRLGSGESGGGVGGSLPPRMHSGNGSPRACAAAMGGASGPAAFTVSATALAAGTGGGPMSGGVVSDSRLSRLRLTGPASAVALSAAESGVAAAAAGHQPRPRSINGSPRACATVEEADAGPVSAPSKRAAIAATGTVGSPAASPAGTMRAAAGVAYAAEAAGGAASEATGSAVAAGGAEPAGGAAGAMAQTPFAVRSSVRVLALKGHVIEAVRVGWRQ